MKSKILYLLIGGAIGFFTAKSIYQKRADEEIRSVVEEFNKLKKDETKKTEDVTQKKAEAIRKNYASAIKKDEKNENKSAYEMIDENEFDTCEDSRGIPYETDTLYYFEDGILANRENDVVKDIKSLIGTDNLVFDYNDALYFRNHLLKLDIEILRDERYFSDVKKHEQYYEED